jgi:hypothetical protein
MSERYRSSLCPAKMKSVLEVGSRTMECPKREGMIICEPPVLSVCLRWEMMSRDRGKEGERSALQQTPFAKADVVAVQARVLEGVPVTVDDTASKDVHNLGFAVYDHLVVE